MRNKNRIPVLLDIYARDTVKESYLRNVVGLASRTDILKYISKWKVNEEKIEEEWLKDPNLRMSELLILTKTLPNLSGNWAYTEDEVFMERYGIADKRATTIYSKLGTEFEKGIPLKSTSDKDLVALKNELGDDTPNYILKELEFRREKAITVSERNNPYYILEIDS